MSDVPKRKRPNQKKIYLTDREKEFLDKKVQKISGGSFQSYALEMLLSGEVVRYDYSELLQLNYQIGKLGNNINQLARAANAYQSVRPEDIKELTDELHQLRTEMQSSLDKSIRKKKVTNGLSEEKPEDI